MGVCGCEGGKGEWGKYEGGVTAVYMRMHVNMYRA